MAVFENRKLDFTPGTDFGYSTYGYVVLGLIIEKISGISFEEYLQEHIWNKAGMSNTGIEKYGIDYPNKSALYHYEKKKTVDGTKNNLSNRVPGGGVYSTLQVILKFGNGILVAHGLLQIGVNTRREGTLFSTHLVSHSSLWTLSMDTINCL